MSTRVSLGTMRFLVQSRGSVSYGHGFITCGNYHGTCQNLRACLQRKGHPFADGCYDDLRKQTHNYWRGK